MWAWGRGHLSPLHQTGSWAECGRTFGEPAEESAEGQGAESPASGETPEQSLLGAPGGSPSHPEGLSSHSLGPPAPRGSGWALGSVHEQQCPVSVTARPPPPPHRAPGGHGALPCDSAWRVLGTRVEGGRQRGRRGPFPRRGSARGCLQPPWACATGLMGSALLPVSPELCDTGRNAGVAHLPNTGWRGVPAPPPEIASVYAVSPALALAAQLRGRRETEPWRGLCPPPSFPQRSLPLHPGPAGTSPGAGSQAPPCPVQQPRAARSGSSPASQSPSRALGLARPCGSVGTGTELGWGWASVSSQQEHGQLHSHPHALTPPTAGGGICALS